MSLELQTKRLLLRPWKPEDAEGMFALNQAPDVLELTGDAPFKNLDEVKELIRNYDQFEKYKTGRFTIIEKLSKKYIGWCGLSRSEDSGETDLGYRILPEFRGQGIAVESAIVSLQYGFETLGLKNIIGRATQENTASISILKKIGMTFEKMFEEHGTLCVQYRIRKEDWLKQQNSHPAKSTEFENL